MNEIQKAIKELSTYTGKFPTKEIQVLRDHWEEAKPYLYEALDYIIRECGDIAADYELHIYAFYLLAEFQEREAFEKIVAAVSIPSTLLEELLGDIVTEGLNDILYNTYNGNLQVLKDFINKPDVNVYACMEALYVMGQIYLDGGLEEAEWKEYLRNLISSGEKINEELYTTIVKVIYQCHFVDMLPDIRSLFDQELVQRWVYGDYDDCVDAMFDYSRDGRFCKSPVSVQQLSNWAMYEQEEDDEPDKKVKPERKDSFSKTENKTPAKSHKIGRNDPCPCGSGKKYKHCCLNKPKEGLDAIEGEENRKIRLKKYPETGVEKQEGRVYLEDFYDQESIEIDRLFYLGFKCRPSSMWHHNGSLDDSLVRKRRQYLWEGFLKYTAKMQKEGIETNEEYDKKYSIHYFCREWQEALLTLLEESEEHDKYQKVLEYMAL